MPKKGVNPIFFGIFLGVFVGNFLKLHYLVSIGPSQKRFRGGERASRVVGAVQEGVQSALLEVEGEEGKWVNVLPVEG